MDNFKEVRETLLKRRNDLNRRIHDITADVRHIDGPLPPDFSEQAVEREGEEVLDALGAAGRLELSQINRTLARIDTGEYGVCTRCSTQIPEARLAIIPHSELCVACAEKLDD